MHTLRTAAAVAVLALALPAAAQDHVTGTITLDVLDNGYLGKRAGTGGGFVFTEPGNGDVDGVYEAQLMVAVSPDQISGRAYASSSADPDPDEWVATAPVQFLTPPFPAPFDVYDQGVEANYDDSGAENPIGLAVRQRSYTSSANDLEDIVFLEYAITNATAERIGFVHVGLFVDFDLADFEANTCAYYDTDASYVVCQSDASPPFTEMGTAVLGTTDSGHHLTLGAGAGTTNGDMYDGMTSAVNNTGSGDVRTVIAQGPYSIPQGGTLRVYFALIAGDGFADFAANARTANRQRLMPVDHERAPRTVTDALSAPVPNPARGDARVTLSLDAPQAVRVTVVDVLGRTVAVLADGPLAGDAAFTVDAAALAPGVYAVRAEGETFRQTRTLTVAR